MSRLKVYVYNLKVEMEVVTVRDINVRQTPGKRTTNQPNRWKKTGFIIPLTWVISSKTFHLNVFSLSLSFFGGQGLLCCPIPLLHSVFLCMSSLTKKIMESEKKVWRKKSAFLPNEVEILSFPTTLLENRWPSSPECLLQVYQGKCNSRMALLIF